MKKILSFLMMALFANFVMADSYVKVTATPTDWEGDYLFVYEAENVAFNGGLATLDAAKNTIAVEIADGAIAANETTNAAKFTLAAVEGGYSVKSASGKYIGVSSYSNGLKQADAVGSYVHNSLSIDEDGNAIIAIYNESWNTTGGSMILNFNSNSSDKRFRYYKGGSQKKIQIYKFTASSTPDPEATHTYTVAGSSDVAFGTTWAPANTANDMVKQDNGTYKWEKTDLTLPAGAIEFKVCEDHDWKVSYPAQNYSLNIAEAGIYTITITFDPAAESDKVAAVATKTGEAVVVPSVAMHGNFTGDKWADTENFALADNKESASLKLTLAAGNYEFGMRIGGSGNWTSNGVSFTRENASAVVEAGEGNLKLAADEAGDYTFTWTFADNKLTITFPEKKLTPVPEENYIIHWDTDAEKVIGNVILHAGAEIGSAKIHTNTDNETGIKLTSSYVYAEDKYVVLKLANGKFKAGDVIEIATFFNNSDETKYGRVRFYAADGATQLFETKDAINGRLVNDDPVLEQFVLEAEQDSILLGRYGNTGVFITKLNVGREGGAPEPVLANGYYLIGQKGWDVAALSADLLFTANPENEGEFQLSVTLVKDEGVKVVKVENDAIAAWYPEGMGNEYKVDEAHAGEVTIYFRPEGNSDWADFGGFMYVAKNAATAISNTAVEAKAQKMIQNGQLFILRDGKTYTVQGMQVK